MAIQTKSKLLTSAMAAKILGLSPDYIRRLVLQGAIKAEKLGHDWLMTEKAISHIKRKRQKKEL